MRLVSSLLLISVLGYGGLLAALYAFQERLVFFPSRVLTTTPRNVGLGYDDVRITVERGVTVHGWFIPATDAAYTVLFFHGNAGNISHRLDSIRILHGLGLSTLVVDYRGYGQSSGAPSEEGLYRDAEAAWNYLTKTRGIPASRILVFGRSMGAALAGRIAARHPVRALIIESGFTSVADMGKELYPYVPARLITRLRFDTQADIARVRRPTLVIHSRDDEIIPFSHGLRLFKAAREPKAMLAISGSHNDGFLTSGERYVRGLAGFIEALSLEEPGASR